MYNELVKMTGIDMYQLEVDIVGYEFEIELHDCLLTVKLFNFNYPKYNYTRQLLSGKLLPEDYEMPLQPQNKTYSWNIPQDYTGGIAYCDMQKLNITLTPTKDHASSKVEIYDKLSSIADVDKFGTYYNIEPDFKNYNPQHSQVVDANDPSCLKYKKILEQASRDMNCKAYM